MQLFSTHSRKYASSLSMDGPDLTSRRQCPEQYANTFHNTPLSAHGESGKPDLEKMQI